MKRGGWIVIAILVIVALLFYFFQQGIMIFEKQDRTDGLDVDEETMKVEVEQFKAIADYRKVRFAVGSEQEQSGLRFSIKIADSSQRLLNNTGKSGQDTIIVVQSVGNGDGIANGLVRLYLS